MNVTPESVRQLVNSDDYGDRLRGVNQVEYLDDAIAYEILQPAIADSNPRVRYAAVSKLANLGRQDPSTALTVLRDCLHNDPEPDVKAAAADAIGALHLTDAFEDLQQVYRETSEWLIEFSIIATLGEMGDPRAFDLLSDALGNENELMRMTAIGALGELADERAVPLLIPFATDPDWQTRYRVAQALGRIGTDEGKSTLEQLANDEVEPVAQEAKHHLG